MNEAGEMKISKPFLMILGCLAAIALAFILPALGVKGDFTLIMLLAAMLACHALMMGEHGKGKGQEHGAG